MIFIQTFIGPMFYKLLYMSLTALAAGTAVLLIRRLADKRFSPVWKYAMWVLVLAALVIPWRPQSRVAVLGRAEAVQDVSFREDLRQAEAAYSVMLSEAQSPAQEIEAARSEAAALRVKTLAFDELLPLLWLCGAAGVAAFMGIGAIRLRRGIRRAKIPGDMTRYEDLLERCKRRLGIKRRVRIVLQSHVGTPALLGLLRPVILLPGYAANMSDERLEYVILHELSHLRRGDNFVNALLLALRIVYWFNPLVWLLFRYIREDMELANDAAVLRGMEQENRKEYSLSLVEVLAGCGKQKPVMLCMADSKKNIERRIGMIQLGEFFKKRKWVIAVAGLLVIAGVAALFLTAGAYGAIRVDSSLEQYMEEVAGEQYASEVYPPGFLITATKIHGAYRENDITKVFVTTWYSTYIEEEDGIREFSGGVVPAAVTCREEDGIYSLIEYKGSSMGVDWEPSIRAFCVLPSGREIRGLADRILEDYGDNTELGEMLNQKLEAYLAERNPAESELSPLTLEQSISQAILQSYDGWFNAELHKTLLTEELDGLTNVYVGYEAAQLAWAQGAFAVQSASGSVGIFRFSRDEAGVYTLEDAEYGIEFANDHAEWKEKTSGIKDSGYAEMPRNILFGYGEEEYWVKGTPVGKYLPKGVFSREYMPDFKEGFGSDGSIVYYWSKSTGEGDTLQVIRKIELELCDEGVDRYHFKDYGIDDGYKYESVNLTLEQAGKLAADFARDFWQDGDKLTFKHAGEGASNLYDPGNVENWQAARNGKNYNVMVDLRNGAVIFAAVDAATTPGTSTTATTSSPTQNQHGISAPPASTTRPGNRRYSSYAQAAALEALFPQAGLHNSGNPVYPDFIGGMYYDDNFNLVVQLVEKAASKDPALYSRVEGFLAQEEGIIVEYVEFSENELYATMDHLDSYWVLDKKPDVFSNVDTYRLDTINNRVEVWLRVYNEHEITRFREAILDSPTIVFVQSRGTPTLL